jgi:serine kinase of HPr protein (carbohydrate metabolism regulator)
MRTTLPEIWHIVVTENNYKDVNTWFKSKSGSSTVKNYVCGYYCYITNKTVPILGHTQKRNLSTSSATLNYSFGEEITYKEFKVLVLKQEIKLPKDMSHEKYLKKFITEINKKYNE